MPGVHANGMSLTGFGTRKNNMKFPARFLGPFFATMLITLALGLHATPSHAADFVACKAEACALPRAGDRYFVRYGGERVFSFLETEGQRAVACNAPLMGDMVPGKPKACGYLPVGKTSETWTQCALQGGVCDTKVGTDEVRRMRLGYGGTWVYFYTSAKQLVCGLPYLGLDQERACQISNVKFKAGWKTCGDREGAMCALDGNGLHLVRYIEKSGAKRHLMQLVSGKGFVCSQQTFRRDPAPYGHKMCEVASLTPVGSDVVGGVLKKEFDAIDKAAAEKAAKAKAAMEASKQTLKFANCVKSNTYEKPTVTYRQEMGWGKAVNMPIPKNSIDNSVGWRSCALGNDGKVQILSYGSTASSNFIYQELQGMKTMYCDYKLLGDVAPGKPTSCWTHKPATTAKLTWTRCATDGKTCNTGLNRSKIAKGAYVRARYGKGNTWIYRYVSGNFRCANADMGVGMGFDPVPGTAKECQIAIASKTTPKWVKCANDNGTCNLPTDRTTYLIRYGNSDNSQASFSLVSGNSFKCALGNLTGRGTFKLYSGRITSIAGGTNVGRSVAPGDIIDPAPGKPKGCAYAIPEGSFKPEY